MRIVVFGAGAVGSLFGGLLQRGGEEVLLVGRGGHVEAIHQHGLHLEGTVEATVEIPALTQLPPGSTTDLVLLTVKTYDLAEAAETVAGRLTRPAPLAAFQNGLFLEPEILEGAARGGWDAGSVDLIRGVNTVPATFVGPGRVRQAGTGEVLLPRPRTSVEESPVRRLFDAFHRAGIPARWVDDVPRELWRKALVNAAINPITADHRVLNGQLLREPWREQAHRLLEEARTVAAAEGFRFSPEEAEEDLWHVVRATAENRSSMLQDVERGRRTEIDAISGAILRAGTRHGLRLPATEREVRRLSASARASQHT